MQGLVRGSVADAEGRGKPKCRAEDNGHASLFQQGRGEGFVVVERRSGGGCLADQPLDRRVDVEGALGRGALDPVYGAQAFEHEVAAAAEDLRARAEAAEARLEAAARDGARAVADARAEVSEWRSKALAAERELASLRDALVREEKKEPRKEVRAAVVAGGYARAYHRAPSGAGRERGREDADAPAIVTADFLDALGTRLSNVKDLLTQGDAR